MQDRHRFQIGMVIREFKYSKSTAKQEIACLRMRGLVEFVENGRAGHYKLK